MTTALRVVLRLTAALAVSLIGAARAASAQAFVPPAGEGNVTVSYQNLRSDGHLDLNGDRMIGDSAHDPTQSHVIVMETEFGLTDRFAISGSLPYIRSTYEGTFPHHVGGITGPVQEWDDGQPHGTFQDFHLGVRYSLTQRRVAITPSLDVVIPSHHYASLAHAAVGKDLRTLGVAANVGAFLDAWLPRLFFQTQVSHAWAQEVLGIRPNRSRVDGELGYFITTRLSVRVLEGYQVTHRGIDLLSFTPMTDGLIHGHEDIEFTGEYKRNHDRLQRANYLSFGGGVGFTVNDSLEIFVDAAKTVWGENIHPLRGISVGVNTHFAARRTARP